MILTMPVKTLTLALAIGAFGFIGSANAADAEDVITGIIGEAIEGDGEGDDADDPRCEAWANRCEAGHQPSCAREDANCGDDEGADN